MPKGPTVVLVECDRCRRPIAYIEGTGRLTEASAGSVREASSDGATSRYRLACTARRHAPEVRTYTRDTLRATYYTATGTVDRRSPAPDPWRLPPVAERPQVRIGLRQIRRAASA